jgi:hypothetical protein
MNATVAHVWAPLFVAQNGAKILLYCGFAVIEP